MYIIIIQLLLSSDYDPNAYNLLNLLHDRTRISLEIMIDTKKLTKSQKVMIKTITIPKIKIILI